MATRTVCLLGLVGVVACDVPPPQHAAPLEEIVELPVSPLPVQDFSTQTPGRSRCTSVVVLVSPEAKVGDRLLSLLEGHMISGGLRVVSSGITGRVVTAPERLQEGAAQLQPLERALVLREGTKADCLFQLFRLETNGPERARRFVWRFGESRLRETFDVVEYDSTTPSRRWLFVGPSWTIAGKVVEVTGGEVWATIDISFSTVSAVSSQTFKLRAYSGVLEPSNGGQQWRFDRQEDHDRVRPAMMAVLVNAIIGPKPGADALAPPSN